ncbi:MAG: PD40 domain-containing protein [Myxococcales bacterium]|nr:PD40 domain-containing protein [Myxococcales bacterium]
MRRVGRRVAASTAALGLLAGCILENPGYDPIAASASTGVSAGSGLMSAGTGSTDDATAATSGASGTGGTSGTSGTSDASATSGTATGETSGETSGTTGDLDGPDLCGIPAGAWKFVGVAPLDTINTNEHEGDPVLSADGHVLYFIREGDVWRATRAGPGEAFGAPELDTQLGLNTTAPESKLSFSADELAVYMATERQGGVGGYDVWRLTRSDVGAAFSEPALVDDVNSDKHDFDPHVSGDELRLYHAPYLGEKQEIVVSTRDAVDQPFSPPTPLMGVNSPAGDADPALSEDELVIVFSSARSGVNNLYVAVRPSLDAAFLEPEPLTGINDPDAADGDPYVAATPLGCELFFASKRVNGLGDLYRVEITE